jgi:hypothetical protein
MTMKKDELLAKITAIITDRQKYLKLLTSDQLSWLTSYQLSGLTSDQLSGLTSGQLSWLTTKTLESIKERLSFVCTTKQRCSSKQESEVGGCK